jgi:hypothetical protein
MSYIWWNNYPLVYNRLQVWLKLKVGNSSDEPENVSYYEVSCTCCGGCMVARQQHHLTSLMHSFAQAHVEYNRERYRPPFLAVLEAWELECPPGKRELRVQPLDLPAPRYEPIANKKFRGTSPV